MIGYMECPECGEANCRFEVENYIVYYECPDCSFEGHDFFEDLYGCMSVPWGYLL